jgi:RNA polymerase sigma-70 factor (ECF subfamily)
MDDSGNLNIFLDQDRALWDQELIAEGLRFMELSATGSELSEFHIEAAIAAVHATSRQAEKTDWTRIVSLYDTLMTLRPSPGVALNRSIAVGERDGPERGLEELHAIADSSRLSAYPFYPAALGDLELRLGKHEAAQAHFRAALALARNEAERQFLLKRMAACKRHV